MKQPKPYQFSAADTVVLTHLQPVTSDTSYSVLPQVQQELLEKPSSKEDNLRMLLDLNGNVCEVVTGVCIGLPFPDDPRYLSTLTPCIAYPILTSPGYQIKSVYKFFPLLVN